MFGRRVAAAFAAALAFFAMGMSPAFANSSAASADVTAPIRETKGSPLSGGDEQFEKLFNRWEAMDNGNGGVPTTTSVAVPSRMPVDHTVLTSGYGMRTHPVLGGRRAHKGIDLASPIGTPVYATADGVVSRADRFSSYGLFISIEHGASIQTRYAHLSKLAVASGEHVKKGDIIGYVGTTGRSTGPHLHYEVRVAGEAVNPIPYMVETQAQQQFALATGVGGQGDGDDE
ncbi:MAG: M23 family metallopeptidase [Sphingomonadales bacterium]|nr:M23 family metallopeptidase [Sphingomonadales bacterium]MBD3774900.1 M23 family metallopeptidase [Paracoccaceae bacterium]